MLDAPQTVKEPIFWLTAESAWPPLPGALAWESVDTQRQVDRNTATHTHTHTHTHTLTHI